MYCPRKYKDNNENNYENQENSFLINKNFKNIEFEYSLNQRIMGPLSSSPPNLWNLRLKNRIENY